MATEDVTPLPPREVLEERLEALRDELFRVQGICGLAITTTKYLAETEDRGDHRDRACDAWQALEAAYALLDEALAKVWENTMLEPPAPEPNVLTPTGETRQ